MTLQKWLRRRPRLLELTYQGAYACMTAAKPLFTRLGYNRADRWLRPLERRTKGWLFGCRMCGQCILHSTGMTCPMTCPKHLRNGACGGVRLDGHCEVIPDMTCVWVNAFERACELRSYGAEIRSIQPALNHRLEGSSAWVNMLTGADAGLGRDATHPTDRAPAVRASRAEIGYKSSGHLERVLRSGVFAVTAELTPPDSTDPEEVFKEAALLAPACDALNATDGPGANCHMSSVAMCALLTRAGYSPVMQVSCRDRNRIAIQGDVLGAAAMGVSNILCLTGDDVTAGDQPEAKRVFDLDSVQLLHTIRIMRDRGMFLSGRKLAVPPQLFLGAVCNPFMPPNDWRPLRLAKKVAAGADFIQSQYCFDVPRLRQFMARFRDLGLDKRVYYLVGVGPLRSDKAAEYMRTRVPGVYIPDAIVDRLRKTPKGRQREEGKRICVEIIQQIREIEGVSGVHLMAFRQQELIPEIVAEAGLLPRPWLTIHAKHGEKARQSSTG